MSRNMKAIIAMAAIFILLPFSAFARSKAEAEEPVPAEPSEEKAAGKYNEAPQLTELVKQGKLPPVEERLPKEPMVVEVEEIGVYGGELYYPTKSEFEHDIWIRESLCLYEKGTIKIGPGLAKTWEVSPDGTEYTFYLREGHKWSDGHPFTADDIVFWYNDIMLNKDINPNTPSWISPGGEAGKVFKIDDTTVKFKFAAPHGLFPKWLCFTGAFELEKNPAHYLKQFHIDYGDKAEIEKMVKDGGFDNWKLFFWSKRDRMKTPDCPTLAAWHVVKTWPENDNVLERNPYYYKVDQAGNQLPYIDKVIAPYVESSEVARLKAMDGQTDYQIKNMGFTDYTLLKENEERGGYRVLKWKASDTSFGLYINQCHQDPAKRKIFTDRRFRIAVSHSIDRDHLNNLLMAGLGTKRQGIAHPDDPYAKPGMGEKYLEYDPDKANQLLDEIGLDKKSKDGWRLLPNGEVLEITIETFEFQMGARGIEVYDIVAEDMREVGLKTVAKEEDAGLWYERSMAGLVDIPGYAVAGISWDIDPLWYVPYNKFTFWAPLYGAWYQSDGKDGEEPPPELKQVQDWYDQLAAEPDDQKRTELGSKILQVHDENLYIIGVINQPFDPLVANKRLRNVLEAGLSDFRSLYEAQAWPEQMFYVDGKRK